MLWNVHEMNINMDMRGLLLFDSGRSFHVFQSFSIFAVVWVQLYHVGTSVFREFEKISDIILINAENFQYWLEIWIYGIDLSPTFFLIQITFS